MSVQIEKSVNSSGPNRRNVSLSLASGTTSVDKKQQTKTRGGDSQQDKDINDATVAPATPIGKPAVSQDKKQDAGNKKIEPPKATSGKTTESSVTESKKQENGIDNEKKGVDANGHKHEEDKSSGEGKRLTRDSISKIAKEKTKVIEKESKKEENSRKTDDNKLSKDTKEIGKTSDKDSKKDESGKSANENIKKDDKKLSKDTKEIGKTSDKDSKKDESGKSADEKTKKDDQKVGKDAKDTSNDQNSTEKVADKVSKDTTESKEKKTTKPSPKKVTESPKKSSKKLKTDEQSGGIPPEQIKTINIDDDFDDVMEPLITELELSEQHVDVPSGKGETITSVSKAHGKKPFDRPNRNALSDNVDTNKGTVNISAPLERHYPMSYRAISGRKSIRSMRDSSFQNSYTETYRRINTDFDNTASSMNVTVGSDIPQNSSFSFFSRAFKRQAPEIDVPEIDAPPTDENDKIEYDDESKSPKRRRLDLSGLFGIVTTPVTKLRQCFSRTKIQSSTPNSKTTKDTIDNGEVGVENVSLIEGVEATEVDDDLKQEFSNSIDELQDKKDDVEIIDEEEEMNSDYDDVQLIEADQLEDIEKTKGKLEEATNDAENITVTATGQSNRRGCHLM